MMTDDIELRWTPFSEVRNDMFSYEGATTYSLNFGTGLFVAVLLVASMGAAFNSRWKRHLKYVALLACAISIFVTISCFLAVPKTEVRLIKHPVITSRMNLRSLGQLFLSNDLTNNVSSLAEARIVLKKIQKDHPGFVEQNPLLGNSVHEEDSPGNYVLRQSTNGIDFVWFDADGGEHPADK
jgi:hypothetical protein